jgi:alcohol dehydrogenase (cytochrome c)
MRDGSLLWSTKIADFQSGQYLSMPPLIFEDHIIYGPAGADWGAKNWVGAFDLGTGQQKWRFNLIPDANEPGADTWGNPVAREHGGGSLWTPLALDVEKGVLYLPVGNPSPDFYEAARPGDNLYTNSAVALDVRSGKLIWYRQFGPADEHDRDLSQVSPLFNASINGKVRELIAISGKDGLLRVLDRETHEQLFEIPITSRTGWDAAPTVEGTHSCPGLLGGVEWNGPAYSRATHALYVATVDWCATFTKTSQPPQFTINAHYYGGAATPDPVSEARGWLRAVEATTGKEMWKRQWPTPLVAGITVSAGGVLFSGDMNNNFFALDAKTGKTLYTFNTGGSVGGGVISYEVNGKQYVATTSGTLSGFFHGSGTAAVVVFALP